MRPDSDDVQLEDLLERIQFVLREPLDFLRSDSEATATKVRLLTAAATYFNVLSVADFGGRTGSVRGEGLIEQVVGAAFQTYGEVDPHPGPFDKAAMLLRGITQGHPFSDGNKRTGFLLASYYLELVGHPVPDILPVDDVVAFCLRVSAGEIRDVAVIADHLRALWNAAD